jgi:hypothetical protein
MQKVLRKILEILDGTPAVYGKQKGWNGQSVVELSLVTPILIVLLMGLAEIGWFANNFLILLEVTRVGARYGTTQTGETSPLAWNNDASRSPYTSFDDTIDLIGGRSKFDYRDCSIIRDPNNREVQGFYNSIACVMRQQMDPLVLSPDNGVDDIVISAFSLQAINPSTLPGTSFYQFPTGSVASQNPMAQITPSLDSAMQNNNQVIVVGRYPSNANECTVNALGDPVELERDPFDYFQDSRRNYQLINPALADSEDNRNFVELEGYDSPSYAPYIETDPLEAQPSPVRERQRGWVFFSQHGISDLIDPVSSAKNCFGSEWSIREIQELFNITSFIIGTDATKREQEQARIPSQGMVMVEMFWQHELLLKNPIFNPVWTILGDNTTVSVWAAFPLPATEPRINIE